MGAGRIGGGVTRARIRISARGAYLIHEMLITEFVLCSGVGLGGFGLGEC